MDNTQKNHVVRYSQGEFKLVTEGIPKADKGQVLIRVAYSTVNPVDKIWSSTINTEGFALGSDGSGTIIQVG